MRAHPLMSRRASTGWSRDRFSHGEDARARLKSAGLFRVRRWAHIVMGRLREAREVAEIEADPSRWKTGGCARDAGWCVARSLLFQTLESLAVGHPAALVADFRASRGRVTDRYCVLPWSMVPGYIPSTIQGGIDAARIGLIGAQLAGPQQGLRCSWPAGRARLHGTRARPGRAVVRTTAGPTHARIARRSHGWLYSAGTDAGMGS